MEDVLKTAESAIETTKTQKTNKTSPASRVRPLSLKVPVTVQGSLPSANSEEFSEETNTIIVFQYGAVVRLSACVNVGQLLVLTNRNTNQEVLCSVIKIKADPDTKDYVELQFSQPQQGFWQQDGRESISSTGIRRAPEKAKRENQAGASVAENRSQDRFTPVSENPSDFAEGGSNPSTAMSLSAMSVAVLENPGPAEAAQLNSPEIRGAGFWDASFPQEILAAAATASSEYKGASVAQPQRQDPMNGSRPHRAAPRPEVIPFRTPDDRMIVRGDLLAKAKIGIAALGLAAIAGVVGVAMHAQRPASTNASAPLSAAAPATASDITSPTTPETEIPAAPAPVAREKLRQSDAEQAESQPQESAGSNTDRASVSTKPLPLSSRNLKPILGTAAAKPVSESFVAKTPQVAASRETLPLDLNPKFDDPAPGSRTLSMLAPAAVSAPLTVGGKFQQARLISSMPPTYPNNARNLRIEGAVVVHGTIDVNGQVTNMSVVSGAAVLRPAALEAIRKWKYAPGLLDGKPAPTDVDITVEFHIH